MKRHERITSIIMLFVISLSNVATPLADAAELRQPSAPVTIKNTIESAHFTDIPMPGQNGILASSTSLLTVANKAFETRDSAFKHIQVQMQKLEKKVYDATEDVTVGITNPDNEPLTTAVVDEKGNTVKVPIVQSDSGNTTDIQLLSSNTIKPGLYKVMVTDQEKHTTEQDFTWGVLAMNTDKSIYHPHEKANLAFGVLNDKGDMVCNADVELRIENSELGIDTILSTQNGKITVNNQCQSHDFSLTPDYQATYQFGGPGFYTFQVSAVTENGTHTISETIQVKDRIPFDVQRTSATRIYPPNTYPMIFNVTANRDFTGTVTETVPESFTITPATQSAATSYTNMQTMYIDPHKDPTQELADVLGSSTSQLVMPFQGNFPITQGFGTQLTDSGLQAFYTHFGLAGHDGIDFGLPMNTPLYAVDEGDVVWAGPGDYGTMVTIQHSWGKTYYGHMSNTSVTVGQHVSKGQLIGYSGMSGEATGPHLHFGMKPNNPDMNNGYYGKIDAMPYLPFGHVAQSTTSIGPQISLAHSAGVNTAVLGTTTSASPSAVPTASSSAAVSESPTPSASVSATPTVVTPTPTPATNASTTLPRADNENFSVLDKEIQLNEQLSNNTLTEKVKVITWHVSLKKGESTSLGYQYQTPKISPQFYLLGPLRFYSSSSDRVIFQEQRQWQIANDDVGVEWFQDTTGPKYNGYSWQYRKKLIIDHTKTSNAQFASHPTPTFMESGTDATQDLSMFNGTGSGTCTSDNTMSETGPRSLKCTSGGTGAPSYVNETGVVSDTGNRVSFYFNATNLGTSNASIVQTKNAGGNTIFNLRLTTAGVLQVANSTPTQLGTDGPTLLTGKWYRITFSYTVTSTTVYSFKVYVNGSQVISDTCNSCGTALGFNTTNGIRFGWQSSGSGNNDSISYDDVYIDNGTDLSDTGDIHVTAKLPIANGATNGFTTNGTPTGFTSCTDSSTHCTYVNEQPLNSTAFLSTTTAGTRENFTLQSASQGDVDISQATLLADEGWLYNTYRTALVTTCTAQLTMNGTDYSFTLTGQSSGFTMYTHIVNNNNFPSSTQGIGTQSCGTNDLLAEAGVLIAYIPATSATYTPTTISPLFMDDGGDSTNTNGGTNFLNSGATNPGGFWANETIGTGSSLTADCTLSHTGPCSYKAISAGGPPATKADLVTPSIVASTSGRISSYFYWDNPPSGTNAGIFLALQSATNTNAFALEYGDGAGNSLLHMISGTGIGTGTTVLKANTWYRVSIAWQITSTTSYEIIVYLNDKMEMDIPYSGTALSTASLDHYRIGNLDNQDSTSTLHFDDIYSDNGSNMTDIGDIRVTGKHPLSNGASNVYTTSGSPTGFATGATGNAQYVSERPINTGAYVTTSTSGVRENYTLESASQGDVDISSAGIVANQAWVYATVGTAGCTGLITNNGVDSSIALTTSNAMFTDISTNANFLSGNQGVGIQSCSTNPLKLYEAGMMIAYTPNNPANTLTNFPVEVNITDTDLKNQAQSSGNDIAFTDSTGRTKLNHEIENYNSGTGALTAWVQIPALSTSTDTIIYMYYGNPAASNQQNATGAWNGNYTAVYHLGENAASTTINDSTSDAYTGTAAQNTANTATTGQIDGAQNFNGTTDKIDIGDHTHLDFGLSSFTFLLWISKTSNVGTSDMSLWKGGASASQAGYDMETGSATWTAHAEDGGTTNYKVTYTNNITGAWQHLVMVADRSNSILIPYQNGTEGTTASIATLGSVSSPTRATSIGYLASSNNFFFPGKIDEVEILSTALSPGWISTEYNNQNSPSTFVTVGTNQENIQQENKNYAPSLDELMRHGQFFDSTGTIQPFVF